MSAMKLIETTVLESSVQMRFADDADREKASEWIEIRVPTDSLRDPFAGASPLGDLDKRLLAEVRLVALRYARDVIGDETQRLSELVNRRR